MWFFHNPEIIFFTYFGIFNLDFFLPLTLLKLLKLYTCFNVGLKKDVHVVHPPHTPTPRHIVFLLVCPCVPRFGNSSQSWKRGETAVFI